MRLLFKALNDETRRQILELLKGKDMNAIVLLPFIYLAYIWNQLPEKVPLHWNLQGEVDRYGDKTELITHTPIVATFNICDLPDRSAH